MKTYKLNENWSSFSVGDRFKLSTRGNGDLFQLINNGGDYVLAKIPTDLLDEVDYDIWKPKNDEIYYYCDEDGDVFSSKFYDGYAPHIPRYSLGNCFKTKEDAQAMVGWLRARHNLIESGAMFVNALDVDSDEVKCFEAYLDGEGILQVSEYYLRKSDVVGRSLCFFNVELARQSIEEHRDDWLTYLGGRKENGDED